MRQSSLSITFFKAPEGTIAGFCLAISFCLALRQVFKQSVALIIGTDCPLSDWLYMLFTSSGLVSTEPIKLIGLGKAHPEKESFDKVQHLRTNHKLQYLLVIITWMKVIC